MNAISLASVLRGGKDLEVVFNVESCKSSATQWPDVVNVMLYPGFACQSICLGILNGNRVLISPFRGGINLMRLICSATSVFNDAASRGFGVLRTCFKAALSIGGIPLFIPIRIPGSPCTTYLSIPLRIGFKPLTPVGVVAFAASDLQPILTTNSPSETLSVFFDKTFRAFLAVHRGILP